MFRFENPIYLYLLVLIPILALIRFYVISKRRKKLKKFGDPELLKTLTPDVSRIRPEVKFWLLMAALALLIVMLARPQMGTKISREKRNGIEAMIALDISNSMKAEDVVPSRLDKSKMLVERMVDNFTNDKVGLVHHERLCVGQDVPPEYRSLADSHTGNQYCRCHRHLDEQFHAAGEDWAGHHRDYRW